MSALNTYSKRQIRWRAMEVSPALKLVGSFCFHFKVAINYRRHTHLALNKLTYWSKIYTILFFQQLDFP